MIKERMEAWRRTREKGLARFVLVYGLMAWGMPMFVLMAFITEPFSKGLTSTPAIAHYIIWPVAGLLFGMALWGYCEARYRREMAARAEE